MKLLTVNTARPRIVDYTSTPGGVTGIDKRPADGPVGLADPGAGNVGSGVAGDTVCDAENHGGPHQAVYAFAREDLDRWERELGQPISNGAFGENLTTLGVDVSGALIGERWRIGGALLEVTSGRVPCRTFAGWLGELGLPEKGWLKRFTQQADPGAYLRVVEPGEVRAGDPVEIAYRPDHGITVNLCFRAATTEQHLLPSLQIIRDVLNPSVTEKIDKYLARQAGRPRSA
ncbi:MOSC domain-containing protein [Streptomyces sp. NPDC020875]|uniref:MOSC domain-containing protein n=1 Tax=Streptomyces sp. NPDC020875 TaxID=3154898 RepID=UPI0033C49BFC